MRFQNENVPGIPLYTPVHPQGVDYGLRRKIRKLQRAKKKLKKMGIDMDK